MDEGSLEDPFGKYRRSEAKMKVSVGRVQMFWRGVGT